MVSRGLAESRQKAQTAILAGDVLVNGERNVRQASSVPPDAVVELVRPQRFVGRGGEKLEHALEEFGIDVERQFALDSGASTGGFTDCLLQHGAARVYAIDVGYGQLADKLRNDDRVVSMERTNIKDVFELPEQPDVAVIDVSFVGLEKVIPVIVKLLRPKASIVALIKPQFQARRSEVKKGGVVRDPLVHATVIGRVIAWAAGQGLRLGGITTSPLRGPAGNREFFAYWRTP
jgi:23S rRNA (cytidine1920-2'-O)/16S rRNA (cytidine1409-2'-O)-methyltransferase